VQPAIVILKSEHRSISAVLQALKDLARRAQDTKVRPQFQALRSMVRYMDEYPEQLHHPKEDKHLFARLLLRAAQARPLIGELHLEHEHGARLIRELERALLFFEEDWPGGAREFQQAVDAYAEFQWRHMRKEEEQLLPLAERHLQAGDWQEIERAFAANPDPVAGTHAAHVEDLFARIAIHTGARS
jgi:hemerythrin-like domain-containing protein